MRQLHRFNTWLAQGLLACSGLALVAMALLIVANMAMRATRGSIFGTVELVGWLAVCVNGLALAYSQRKREHVAITLFTDKLPLRARRALDVLGVLVGIGFTLFASWGLWRYAENMKSSGSVSTSLEVPYWFLVLLLAFGMAAFLCILVEDLLVGLRDIISGKPEQPTREPVQSS